jgi:alkanesulfonate monooxygenase SsuD/methylene tetrahydromethanopterin reductase-like flavin-dependent oxidoreductase (luciferase family)
MVEEFGLRFAANYHISPSTVLEAAAAYRAAFVPSADLDRPYVSVSADVVVGPDEESSPQEAAAHQWTAEDRALVADRVDTQFVGSPATVAARLRQLQEATDADELMINDDHP